MQFIITNCIKHFSHRRTTRQRYNVDRDHGSDTRTDHCKLIIDNPKLIHSFQNNTDFIEHEGLLFPKIMNAESVTFLGNKGCASAIRMGVILPNPSDPKNKNIHS